MADNEYLRFVLELKDEFSEVWEKIKGSFEKGKKQMEQNARDIEKQAKKAKKALKETNEEGGKDVEKLTKKVGGLSKALAIVGIAAGVGAAVYGAWEIFKNKIADVTKEAELLEATLGNILGSRGAAKGVLQELANSDLTKVFKISEIDKGYTTLANHGLKATLAQMKAIGDLSAGTGQDFGSVIQSIVSGGEGKIQGLQNLGIDVVKNKNKKLGIDDLTLSFRGQTSIIKNNSAAIQKYLLNLGMIPGVQGSMERSADTVAASENNLNNQLGKVWLSLAERFNPAVVDSKNKMSKWIATINSWIEIPVAQKINEEMVKIRLLQTELTDANTTEERRKSLLKELTDINPALTKGIDAQAMSYSKLAENINDVIDALTKKITLANIEKNYSSTLSDYSKATNNASGAKAAINQAIIDAGLYNRHDLTFGQKQIEARKILKARAKKAGFNSPEMELSGIMHDMNSGAIDVNPSTLPDYGRLGKKINPEKKDIYSLLLLEKGIQFNNKAISTLDKLNPDISKMNAEKNSLSASISKTLGLDSVAGKDKTDSSGKTSIDKGGIASVHGGGQIRNVTININHLIDGGVNVHTTTLKEGVGKAKDIVLEGLLTAVNDANLVGN